MVTYTQDTNYSIHFLYKYIEQTEKFSDFICEAHNKLGPNGPAVLTFIWNKQTKKHQDTQTSKVYIYTGKIDLHFSYLCEVTKS